MGEGILHFVKSEMKIGLRPGWPKRLLLRLLRGKALASIMSSLGVDGENGDEDSDDEDKEEDSGLERGVFHRYRKMTTLFAGIAARKPVSLVQLECGQLGAVLRPRTQDAPDSLLEFNRLEEGGFVDHAGLKYWKWKPGGQRKLDPDKVRRSVLLLPYLLPDREEGADVFAAVSTTWSEMDALGEFVVPPPLGPPTSN